MLSTWPAVDAPRWATGYLLYGSNVAVESEPGKGSTFAFVVTLPIAGD